MFTCPTRRCCDAGNGDAAYFVEIPRTGVTKRAQEMGHQTAARFRLCTMHAQRVLDSTPSASVHEMTGWLTAQPCDLNAETAGEDLDEP